MTAELINDNIGTRQKLLLTAGGTLILLLLVNFCKYYFAPLEYQKGLESSRFWFSYNEYLGFSIITIFIVIPIIIASKIVRRLYIDTDKNLLEVEYINRFNIKPTSKTLKLSETNIQVSEYEIRDRYFSKTGEIIYTLYLTNPNFGQLKISGQDFKNIKDISFLFQSVKDNAAAKKRLFRISRRKKKPRH